MRVLLTCLTIVAALCVSTALASAQAARKPGPPSFGGGGGSNPTPPIGLAPIPPTIGRGAASRFSLQLVAPAPRLVTVRDRSGRVLHVTGVEGLAVLVLPVPAGGAVLDVLGGSALGLAVKPGDQLRILSD